MLREMNPVAARRAKQSFRKHGPAVRATCLLCRVLWPIVVQHRHLLFDDSSEAKTIFLQRSDHENTAMPVAARSIRLAEPALPCLR
jgi:hypothetical protein